MKEIPVYQRDKSFKEFVSFCVSNNRYVGLGNPNAPILIIGKEPYTKNGNTDKKSNAEEMMSHIINGTLENVYKPYKVTRDNTLYENWGKHTWYNYQKLIDLVFKGEKSSEKQIDFLVNAFTTEMNDIPSRTTRSADKSLISSRKQMFKESEFIQSFPVIILACSDYITNYGDNREIDDIFGVAFDDDGANTNFSRGSWFYTHHDSTGEKLVIHTRQLSSAFDKKLLDEMAKVIRTPLNLE